MAQVMKKRRLVNAGRRRMTAKQIKYFGTARQRAALKNSRRRRNTGPKRRHVGRRRNQGGDVVSRVERAAEHAIEKIEDLAENALGGVTHLGNRGRRRNVGEILTVLPANPGRRKKMAATRTKNRRRSNRGRVRASNRSRRRNRNRGAVRRHRNRSRMANPKVIVRYRNRARRHNYGRRRNPDFLRGDAGAVVGVLGGAAVTSILTGFLPSNFTTGWMGYIATGVVAAVQGQVIGKVFKNQKLGNWLTVGGMVIVALKIAGDMGFQIPGLTTSSGTSGMGMITGSNFYVPQVNMPGSMASFVTPAGITGAIPVMPAASAGAGMHGLGQQYHPGFRSMRRVGRLR